MDRTEAFHASPPYEKDTPEHWFAMLRDDNELEVDNLLGPWEAPGDAQELLAGHVSVIGFDDEAILIRDEAAEPPLVWDRPLAPVSRFATPGVHDDMLPMRPRRR